MLKLVTLSGVPSTSLSLASTLPAIGVSSAPDFVSLAATGASLTGVTASVSVAVDVSAPSVAV